MTINYRKATLDDKKVIYDMGILLNEFNLQHDLKENLFWDGWEDDIETETAEELMSEHKSIYIAESEDKVPAGYIIICKCSDCNHYEVDQLFVKEEFRSQKVGKGLMQLAIDEAKKDGVPLQLEVYKSNENAISFYEKLGFTESGVLLRMEFE